jgi:hypothetical protein
MRLAALVAAAAAAVNLLALGLLHVVSPEVDILSRAVSEYALGDFGWLATIMTVAEGLGPLRWRWPCAGSEPPRCCCWCSVS